MEYMVWLSISSGIPLIIIFVKYFALLRQYKKTLAVIVLLAMVVHMPWDIYAVAIDLWSFPTGKNFGVSLFNLPLEEWIYTIIVPLFAASVTIIAKYKLKK